MNYKRKNIFINSGDPEYNANFFNQAMDVGSVNTSPTMEEVEEEKLTLSQKLTNLDKEDYKGLHEMYIAANLDLKEKAYLEKLLNDSNKAYKYLLSKQKYVEED